MSDHIPDVTKMIGDTPRTDERSIDMYNTYTGSPMYMVPSSFSRQIERELNAAKDRIKRLEEAGDEMSHTCITIDADRWRKAKEAKL